MGDQLRVGPLEFLVTISQKTPKTLTVSANSAGTVDASPQDDIGGMISDWLSEADEADRKDRITEPETREYKFNETTSVEFDTAKNAAPSSVTQEMPKVDANKLDKARSEKAKADKAKEKPKKKEMGKLPKTATNNRNATKDTQEAAAQTLRKFFNRS
jgi:hypothetical protein